MRRPYLTSIIALATVIATGTAAPGARAGVPHETLIGDYNGDGIPDQVVLGAVAPDLCSTIVSYGTAPGVFQPPIAYTYLRPGGPGTLECPDIGVAFNVDADPAQELWIGWSHDSPEGLEFNRLLLQPPDFTPQATFGSRIAEPVFIGVGIFSADGRQTPYAVGPGGMASSVIEDGSVVAGPVHFCSVDTPTVELADWSQDGLDGVLMSFRQACEDGSSGVVRVRETGTVRILERDPTGATTWTAEVVDANGDAFPDVRTINQTTGEISYFVNDPLTTDFFLHRAPEANPDRIALPNDKAIAIDVLANDFASRHARLTILVPPRYGTLRITSDKRVIYQPNPQHGRTDRFTYQLTEEGKRSKATVDIRFPG